MRANRQVILAHLMRDQLNPLNYRNGINCPACRRYKPSPMTKEDATSRENDALLQPFISAQAGAVADAALAELLEQRARPIIRAIIRDKLRVTLTASDGRFENQEALEIESDCIAELLAELNELRAAPEAKAINNFRNYVAVIAFHTCYKYFRRKHPERGQLKDRLRYLLTNRPMLSLWQTGDVWVCGFAEWRARESPFIRTGQLNRLIKGSESKLRPADGAADASLKLDALIPALLNCAGRPIEFEELVDTVAELQGIKNRYEGGAGAGEDSDDELERIADPRADVEVETDQRFYLQRLWTEICQLPLRQRVALLLNLKDAKGHSMISMFPLTGIASMKEIATALEMALEEFAAVWNELPWEDAKIARQLNLTRQQVVNLRKCARERLARRMRGF